MEICGWTLVAHAWRTEAGGYQPVILATLDKNSLVRAHSLEAFRATTEAEALDIAKRAIRQVVGVNEHGDLRFM